MRTKKALAAMMASAILFVFLGGISAAQETPQKAPQEREGLIEPTRSLDGEQEERGKLSVFSEPPNLDVLLDGEKIGETPVAVEVAPGEHQLAVEDVEQTIVVLPGESLRLSLFKGEFIVIPEEREASVHRAPEQPQRRAGEPQEQVRRDNGRNGRYDPFYWPQNPRGPIY